jgi:DNA-formamidopyrimidine glycosylase
MPEGPEVLQYYKFVNSNLQNQILKNFNILSGKYLKTNLKNIDLLKDSLPLKIQNIVIKGKTIFIELSNNVSLIITHGMTGYWSNECEKHARYEFILDNDNKLYYIDPRNFGTLNIVTSIYELELFKDKLGPYILDEKLTYDDFYSRLGKKVKSKIAIALLDQSLISGIGNYLRCDILWYSKIDGEKRIGELTEEEKQKLYINSVNICKYHSGYKSYNLEFTPQDFQREFYIYMQNEDIYGNTVYKKTLNSRTFHYVK